MPTMNAEGIDAIKHVKQLRQERLQTFMAMVKEEPQNYEAIGRIITEYNNEFEPFVNARYIIQAVNAGCSLWTWVPALAAKYFIAPEFIGSLITFYLCSTLVAHGLGQMTETDFFDRLEEMKTIYDCLLKNEERKYDSSIDNTAKLSQPQIQRMIRLIGPLCTPEYIRVWNRRTDSDNNDISPGFFSSFSRFISWNKNQQNDSETLKNLKKDVELGLLAMNTFDGSIHATRYFLTDPKFREFVQEKLPPGLRSIPPMIKSAVDYYKPHQQ